MRWINRPNQIIKKSSRHKDLPATNKTKTVAIDADTIRIPKRAFILKENL